jgi:hypothetical protein
MRRGQELLVADHFVELVEKTCAVKKWPTKVRLVVETHQLETHQLRTGPSIMKDTITQMTQTISSINSSTKITTSNISSTKSNVCDLFCVVFFDFIRVVGPSFCNSLAIHLQLSPPLFTSCLSLLLILLFCHLPCHTVSKYQATTANATPDNKQSGYSNNNGNSSSAYDRKDDDRDTAYSSRNPSRSYDRPATSRDTSLSEKPQGGGGDPSKSDDTIYISGLPANVTDASLVEHFKSIGVIKVRFLALSVKLEDVSKS